MFLIFIILVLIYARPNIIFIVADDLDTQYGQWINYFPRIKNLMSDEGMTFNNAFVSISLCCPSRTSLLTGRYAHNTHITGNKLPYGGFQKVHDLGIENSTIATWLQDSEYRTVLLGKYLNGYPGSGNPLYIPPGWTEWYVGQNDPYRQFNYILNQNGKLVSYGSQPKDYLQDVITQFAVDFINRTYSKPFFMWMSSFCPHMPAAFAPRYANSFSFLQAPRPPSFNDPNILFPPFLNQFQIFKLDNLYRKRMKSMLAVEDTIQAIITILEQTNQLSNTFIFFTSDNGFHLGQHRMQAGKNTSYDEDLRVPLIVRGPGIIKNSQSNNIILNNDFAPTFAYLANMEILSNVDGRSIFPLNSRNLFLFESSPKGVRTKDYKYTETQKLYNLQLDPYEQNPIYALNELIPNLKNCTDYMCVLLENIN